MSTYLNPLQSGIRLDSSASFTLLMIGEGFELDTNSEQSQGVSLDLNKAKMPALKDELQAVSKGAR